MNIELNRRQFLHATLVGFVGGFSEQGSEKPANKEISGSVQAFRRVPEDIELMEYQPVINNLVGITNERWERYRETVDTESPLMGEVWMTNYLWAATCLKFLETKGLEYSKIETSSRTLTQQRIVELFENLEPIKLAEEQFGRESLELAQVFDRWLLGQGYDGVMATKAKDPGMVFELEIWDSVGENWFKSVPGENNEPRPMRAIVLDVATGKTFQGKIRSGVNFEGLEYQGQPVSLIWWGDLSSEMMGRLNLPAGGKYRKSYPIIVRYKEESLRDVTVVQPEYNRILVNIAPEYKSLAYQYRQLVNSDRFVEAFEQMRSLIIKGESLQWTGDDGEVRVDRGGWIWELMRRSGVKVIRELEPDRFANQVLGMEIGEDWGFPVSWLSQQRLMQIWASAGKLERQIWSVNRKSEVPGSFGGLFEVENLFSNEKEIDPQWMGVFVKKGDGDRFIAFSTFGEVIEGDLDPSHVIRMIKDEDGEVDWRKRIIWYG